MISESFLRNLKKGTGAYNDIIVIGDDLRGMLRIARLDAPGLLHHVIIKGIDTLEHS